jgi:hypothetical protein
MRRGNRAGRGDLPGQFQIDWSRSSSSRSTPSDSTIPAASAPPVVQYLKWDFTTTFPQPTPEAIEAGVISDEDTTPEAVRAIHDEHAREALAVLHEMDVVMDARRRGVDPDTNEPPTLQHAKSRLQKFFVSEPARLEHWWINLMDVYEQSFGAEAADAFGKALRARHAGIPVMAESPKASAHPPPASVENARMPQPTPTPVRPQRPRHIVARLPVPRPLTHHQPGGPRGPALTPKERPHDSSHQNSGDIFSGSMEL